MYLPSLLSLLTLLVQFLPAESTCYSMDGQLLDQTIYKPCNPNAQFSACCALNGTSPDQDICLDSGLCQSTSGWFAGFIWADGCTDQTGKAAVCPKTCVGVPEQYNFNVLQCNPGEFCCRAGYDKNNCCGDVALQVNTSHIGTLLLPNGQAVNTTYVAPGSSSATSSCSADRSATVGAAVGGVLGAALIAALVMLVLLLKQRIHLKRDLETRQARLDQVTYERYVYDTKKDLPSLPVPPYRTYQSHDPPVRPVEMDGNRGLSELSE